MSNASILGTDEYGTSTEVKAHAEGCKPQELCDKYRLIHEDVYRWFNISFDKFGRTTTELHARITQDIFSKLHKRGFVQEHQTSELFCGTHGGVISDRMVVGDCYECGTTNTRGDQCDGCSRLLDALKLPNRRCKMDNAVPAVRDATHLFLELGFLQPEIKNFVAASSSRGGWSDVSTSMTSAWLDKGLHPLNVTRDIRWGVPVPLPGYADKVLYSWFEACIGYISITAEYTDKWEKWWRNPSDVRLFQFMGKDNVPFHSIVFPATLMGTGETWTQPHHIAAVNYMAYEGGKFSKSRGVGVFGDSARATGLSADVWRFFLLFYRPETDDSEFRWDALISANNNLLVGNLASFVTRVMRFVNAEQFYKGEVPRGMDFHDRIPIIIELRAQVESLVSMYLRQLDDVRLREGLFTVLAVARLGNDFLQSSGLGLDLFQRDPGMCGAVINIAVNLIHLLAALVAPYLPETADRINGQLSAEPLQMLKEWPRSPSETLRSIMPGHRIGKSARLFKKIKPEMSEVWRGQFGGGKGEEVATVAVGKKTQVRGRSRRKGKKGSMLPDASRV